MLTKLKELKAKPTDNSCMFSLYQLCSTHFFFVLSNFNPSPPGGGGGGGSARADFNFRELP